MKTLERTETMERKSQPPKQMAGVVRATFPDRGFFWITGSDGQKYFGHQTKVQGGFLILDMWEGQICSFWAHFDDTRGPRAEQIEMDETRA